ncbi:MAG TPA: hypothetical protein ACFE0H_04035 [Elainellaceae cyanobacterium]
MKLELTSDELNIHLTWYEQLLAFYMAERIKIPLHKIKNASSGSPAFDWRAVRLPGTALPGVISAGTYYTHNGREFWYITSQTCLTLAIDDEYFKRIVLTLENPDYWADQIRHAKLATDRGIDESGD